MDSIFRAQLDRMTDDEITAVRDRVAASLAAEQEISPSAYWRCIKKLEGINTVLGERGLQQADTASFRQRCIDAARDQGVPPEDFGETFTSLGVNPWPVQGEVSIVDRAFIARKLAVKRVMIETIKTHPDADETAFYLLLQTRLSQQDYALAQFLMAEYTNNAFALGLIPTADYIPMRDFVVATPVEILEAF